MLARSFLSAAELKISDEQRDALIKVLHALEGDQLPHIRPEFQLWESVPIQAQDSFNMCWWDTGCGTVCCIGGWAERFAGKPIFNHGVITRSMPTMSHRSPLLHLFFPAYECPWADYAGITPEQAALALSNFLTTGKPDWSDILRTRKSRSNYHVST